MADDTAPPPIDLDQIQQAITRLGLTPPTQAPASTADGPGAHGFAGFIGDVGNVLGGGGSGLLGLGPDEQAAAGRRALMAAGVNMLIGGGPSYAPKNFGSVLGHGLEAAMQSRDQSERDVFAAHGSQQQLAQQAYQNRLNAVKDALPYLTLQYNQQALANARQIALGGKPGSIAAAAGADDPVTALPREKALDALAQRESGGKNVPNAEGGDASGYWQIRDATWRDGAKLAGVDITKYPRAIDAPQDVQRQVAGAIYDRDGAKPWAASNPGRPAQTASATPPPAAPATPPGVQVGGAPPPPPGGSTAAAGPYAGGGIGAALQPPKGAPVYTGGEPQPLAKGSPVPSGKLLTSDVGAIQAGMEGARTGPRPPTALTAGPGAPTQTATATPNAPQAGWGSKIPSAYSDSPTITAPAAAPAATTTVPAPAKPQPPPEFQMRPLTPTEQAQTSYDLDPATKADFQRRILEAMTVEQVQAVQKDQEAAKQAKRKDADAARLKIEETARKDWQTQQRPATDQDLATANIPREPGVHYSIDNQGKLTPTAIPVDPRATEASKADQTRYQTNYATPYDQSRPLRAILNEMDALNASVERDPLGGRGGITSDYARKAQQVLSGLGLTSDAIREGTSSQEAYAALSNQLILKLKAASGTSLGQMSDRDLSFIQSSAPNLSQTPQGREKISAALRQIFDYQNRLYNAATDAIHDPASHYTLRDLDKKLAAVPDAIPTLPSPKASAAELQSWKEHHQPKRGMAYYRDDGQVHLWGVPEPAQGQ